jgi:hypothetical protein
MPGLLCALVSCFHISILSLLKKGTLPYFVSIDVFPELSTTCGQWWVLTKLSYHEQTLRIICTSQRWPWDEMKQSCICFLVLNKTFILFSLSLLLYWLQLVHKLREMTRVIFICVFNLSWKCQGRGSDLSFKVWVNFGEWERVRKASLPTYQD